MELRLSDSELIGKILSGDQVAMRILIDRHRNYAFTIALRVLGSREEAEEVAQDSFIKAMRSLSKFKNDSKFTTWFYRIVFNTAVSRKRKKKLSTEEITDHNISLGVENHHSLYSNEQSKYLNMALSRLREEDNLVLTFYYLKELSMEEISEITGHSPNTLKVKLHRARKRLAEVLRDLLKEEVNLLL